MSIVRIVAAALAVWRLTHLIHSEDGPFRILKRMREALRRVSMSGAVECFSVPEHLGGGAVRMCAWVVVRGGGDPDPSVLGGGDSDRSLGWILGAGRVVFLKNPIRKR